MRETLGIPVIPRSEQAGNINSSIGIEVRWNREKNIAKVSNRDEQETRAQEKPENIRDGRPLHKIRLLLS